MHEEMLGSAQFDAGIFIGGIDGVGLAALALRFSFSHDA
jgi:hypothetical protein